jgi:hypothetical protein
MNGGSGACENPACGQVNAHLEVSMGTWP